MDKKIVLIGAGSASFGPPTLSDMFQSDVLAGSTITLVDIDEEKLNIVYDLMVQENKIRGDKCNIEKATSHRGVLKDADFVICSIEHGDRFNHRWEDNTIPHKHGSTEMMAENGGPGGFFHSARQIPEIVAIAKDVYMANPHAFFINYSNPMSRICLAIHRSIPDLNFVGLCHQIGLLLHDLPYIIDDEIITLGLMEKINRHKEILENIHITVGGLNHFAFLLKLNDLTTGKDLMPLFNERCMKFYDGKWDRFKYAGLTFETYKRFGWFPYVGDNHITEYLIYGSKFTKYEDLREWITRMEQKKLGTNDRFKRFHGRLEKGLYPKKGMSGNDASDERGVPIIEEIVQNSKSYETAVNIPNDSIIENLPQDLVIECSGVVDKEGVHGIKVGCIPKNIAALLRTEASIQDVCVEAILKESKDLAIACLAMDINCGSFEMAEDIFNEMFELQKKYLPNFR